jgi:hypothetical protein
MTMHTCEFVGGPNDGTDAELLVVPVVIMFEDGSVYRFSRLRPSGVYEYIHSSLVRESSE